MEYLKEENFSLENPEVKDLILRLSLLTFNELEWLYLLCDRKRKECVLQKYRIVFKNIQYCIGEASTSKHCTIFNTNEYEISKLLSA